MHTPQKHFHRLDCTSRPSLETCEQSGGMVLMLSSFMFYSVGPIHPFDVVNMVLKSSAAGSLRLSCAARL